LTLHPWGRGYKLNRTEKEQVIKDLRDDFQRAKAVIFTDYRGMTVAELSDLRRLLREGNFEYRIVKNTLARIASEGTSVALGKDSFRGPVGIAISYDDPVTTVKKVLDYSKKNDKLKVGIGLIEGSLCEANELKAVAALPSRNVLLSMVAAGFKAPLTKLAFGLNATLNKFVYVLEAIKNKKGNS
jgi:ribosomal protein L10